MSTPITFTFSTDMTVIFTALLALLVFSVAYAALVRIIRRRDPNHAHTATLVVFGVAAVVTAFAIATDLALGALLALFFGVAGLPMIWEFVDYKLTEAERARRGGTLDALTGGFDELHAQNGRLPMAPGHRRSTG